MKILANEIGKAGKAPFTAQLLQFVGISQFIGASWLAITLSGTLRNQIGPVGVVIGVFLAVDLGISASLISFVLARIVTDLNAIRWNTDGYTVEREKDDLRLLSRAIEKLSDNIDRIVHDSPDAEQIEEPEQSETPKDEYDPDNDPYDNFE